MVENKRLKVLHWNFNLVPFISIAIPIDSTWNYSSKCLMKHLFLAKMILLFFVISHTRLEWLNGWVLAYGLIGCAEDY